MAAKFIEPQYVKANGIQIAYYEKGEGFPVLLIHGFPELAYSWRHQIDAIAAAGYRAIALDMRGYGNTDKPTNVEAYGMEEITGDIAGVIQALGLEKAVICSHDWGADMTWEMPVLHPDVTAGIITTSSTRMFYRNLGMNPSEALAKLFSPGYYSLQNQAPTAHKGFTREVLTWYLGRLIRGNMYTMIDYISGPPAFRNIESSYLMGLMSKEPPLGRQVLSDDDLEYYVNMFEKGGMFGPISWYRNLDRNVRLVAGTSPEIDVPTMFIIAQNDIYPPHHFHMGIGDYVHNLEMHMLNDCSHWMMEEKPEELSELIVSWLKRNFPNN